MHKPIRIAMMWALVAAVAAAQAAPAKSTGKTAPASTSAAKPAAAAPHTAAKPAAAAPHTASKPAAAAPHAAARPAAAAPHAASKPAAAKSAKPKATAAASAPKKSGPTPAGKRDPFVNPVKADGGSADQKCTTGPKCLIVAQVVLKGTVKTREGMIAMVENAAKKQYNLRENDEVLNGFVLKITGDSVVFRQTVKDLLGNATTKDVVKRVTVPAI